MHDAARRAARAAGAMARRQIGRHDRPVELAIVATLDPLTVELVEGGLTLGEDILHLGAAFRRHDAAFGVKIGDSVALARQASGEYLVLDVQTDREVVKGLSTDVLAGTTKNLAVSGGNAAMVAAHWIEAYDVDGNLIGYVPVFASRT